MLLLRAHDPGHCLNKKLPLGFFQRELLLTFGRKPVELRALVVLGDSPLGLDPTLAPQPVEGGVEGTVLNLQQVVGLGADDLSDSVAVLGAPLESAEDEEVESALQDVEFVRDRHVVDILPLVWGRLATCGGLAIRLALIS